MTDTGAGMDAATRARIFEPFFTTKPPGFGTGLGLSTTDDIVRAAGGTIEVDSQRGRGTTFTAHLPRRLERARPGAPRGARPRRRADTPTVLVVDDESEVRSLIAEILRGSGLPRGRRRRRRRRHRTARARHPSRRPARDRRRHAGDERHRPRGTRHRARSPTTRVLFVSGFVPAGSPSLRGAPLVAKPLHRAELLDAVHLALDGAA